jgi:hypothetical protein
MKTKMHLLELWDQCLHKNVLLVVESLRIFGYHVQWPNRKQQAVVKVQAQLNEVSCTREVKTVCL